MVGGGALAGVLASSCVVAPDTGRIPGTYETGDLLPGGAKIRGVNLTPGPPDASYTPPWWRQLWSRWDEYFPTWIEPCLDRAAALGCNVVRLTGSPQGVTAGIYTRAEYLARWGQFVSAAEARGLYVYPCGQNPDNDPAMTEQDRSAEIVAWATLMHTTGRCIGLDLVQESNDYTASAAALALYQAVKAVTDLPCTFSVYTHMVDMLAVTADRTDFTDWHLYTVPAADMLDVYWSTGRIKPIVLGEYGANNQQGTTTQIAMYQGVLDVLNHTNAGGHRPAGALAWVIQDYWSPDPTGSFAWGMYDLTGNAKTWMTSLFTEVPKT